MLQHFANGVHAGAFDLGPGQGLDRHLAFHFGAREIVLIGFDLRGSHWNEAHPLRNARPYTHTRHQLSIDAMADPIAAAGVKVWNTSPTSSLKGFEHADLATLV